MEDKILNLRDSSLNNRKQLQGSSRCGCYYCEKIYEPSKIKSWVDKLGETAICPFCHIDSVIAETKDLPLTKEFLQEAHKYWFNITARIKR